jgi:uncharacterized protein YcbX
MESPVSPVISQLFVYPIKSCAGISVDELKFDAKGPVFDRRWMLVDASDGSFLTQRKFPQMALIQTQIEAGHVWAVQNSNPDLEQTIKLPIEGDLMDVVVWSDRVQGLDCGDESAAWFSRLIDHPCRLVYQAELPRQADTEYAEQGTEISYADGFPLLVVAQSSINLLNGECQQAELSARNFRPNIVVNHTPAFAENTWQSLQLDTMKLKVVKPCQRCVIPTLNPSSGEKETEIMPILIKHCRRDKKIYFGQNLTFDITAAPYLRVGQDISINSNQD